MSNDTQRGDDGFSKESLGEKFEVLTNASPDCIKLFNLENKVEYMNPGGLKEHGFKSLEDAIGFDWTLSIVPEQRAEIARLIKEAVTEKKTISLDVQHLHELANREWCSLIVSPVFSANGDVKYFVGISRDISDRKEAEAKLAAYAKEQESLNKMMVDRELKMIQLKNQNECLSKTCQCAKSCDVEAGE